MQQQVMMPSEVRNLLSISKPTELRWRRQGLLPKPKVLGRRVFYLKSEIEAMLAEK